MKQTFTIIFLLIIGLTAYSQKDSIRGRQFQLTGKLIDTVQMTPLCGYFAFGTVVEFEVMDLVGMIYKNKNIGIIITCPRDLYKEGFFEKGKTYQVVFGHKSSRLWMDSS